jgi:deoxyribose-phosphate aldolase
MNMLEKLEYTILSPDCTQAEIEALVKKALDFQIFGVCVPPYWVKAVKRMAGSALSVVTVIGFPLGYQKTSVKLAEAEEAMADGADELDMVMNISAFRSGMESWVKGDIAQLAVACHKQEKLLKVIIETSILQPAEIIRASEICINAGADFVKTSTGFGSAGATVENIRLIRAAIGSEAGIKASGGIKTLDFASKLVEAGANRIGTSSAPEVFIQG